MMIRLRLVLWSVGGPVTTVGGSTAQLDEQNQLFPPGCIICSNTILGKRIKDFPLKSRELCDTQPGLISTVLVQ
ncbi:hypothetical protein E1A91_D02G107500v1 [Gossypium mustelinum]|uniref:Secreted protein n=1 Tax=Gossypium mustelinum TaxID=34275 RepID=A0A5D2VUM1_GOSMU|nr:hypothetical protein E1A91_D02G107500v1 [Gossypium mustelinum]